MFKIFVDGCGGKSGKNNEGGNEEGADEAHAKDNEDRAKYGKNDIESLCINADGASKFFIESHSEDFVMKNGVNYDDSKKQNKGKNDFALIHGKDTAEKVGIQIKISAGKRDDKSADGESACGHQGNGGVAMDF